MATIVTQRPYYYSFSKNQLTWRFLVDAPTAPGCKLQFKLLADTANDIAADQRVFQTELRPAEDGYLSFTVNDIVDSMIDYNVPVFTDSYIVAAQNIKKVTVSFRRITDADPDPDWDESEPVVYVIKGGIELLKHDYNNYFYNYHGPNKAFATWLPKNRMVSVTDEWWMSILFTNADITAPVLTARALKLGVEYTNADTDAFFTTVPATGFAYLLYHMNIGKFLRENADPTKMVWRFTVQIVAVSDHVTPFSEVYTLYADYRQFYDYKIFNFYNSLGGMDHVRILAESEESYTRGYIEADLFANTNDVGAPADKQYFQANFSRQNSTKTDTGYRHSKAEVMAYQELLTSGLIFEIWANSNKYRLIGLLNKSGKIIKTTDKRFGFSIEWRYPFTEQVYTPEIPLGVGYLACIAVVIPGTPSLPAGLNYTAYYYSIPITGSYPFFLSAITKPAWMTIALDGFNVVISGTTDTVADDINVAFTVNNCSGSTATFADTFDITTAPPTLTQISNTNTGPDGTRTQVFEVGPSVTPGDSFYVEVYTHTVTVVAVGGDTPTTVATALKNAVNAASEADWNDHASAPVTGTLGFKPVATSTTNRVTIVLNYQNQFACGAF